MIEQSRIAKDLALLWPMALGTLFIVGFWGFVFFAFSGRVDLKDAVVAGLVGSTMTQAVNVMMVIVLHYFEHGRPNKPESKP